MFYRRPRIMLFRPLRSLLQGRRIPIFVPRRLRDEQSLRELLQDAGYQTALIGKWHLGRKSMPTGFDHWNILDHQGYYYQPKFISPLGRTQHVGYTTDLITQFTLEWLENSRDPERPFLLMMQHKAPHRPWDPAPDRLGDYMNASFPEPPNLFDDYSNRSSAAKRAEMQIANHRHMSIRGPDLKAWDTDLKGPSAERSSRDWFYGKMTQDQLRKWKDIYLKKNQEYYSGKLSGQALTRWKYQRFLQDYLSCVTSLDDSVGQVLDYLSSNGLEENTIVVYSSDQGFFLGEHGWFDKRFMYEESLKTPLLIQWPAVIIPESRETRIVSNVDFAETFLVWTFPRICKGDHSFLFSRVKNLTPGATPSIITTTKVRKEDTRSASTMVLRTVALS